MVTTIRALPVFLLLAVSVDAPAQDRFIAKLRLPSAQTVVVAEGEFEARSTGSFSVRLYDSATPDDTTFFLDGLIRSRDGVVERVVLADVDGDGAQDAVVIVRSVGTGNYQSAHAFATGQNRLELLAEVNGLAHDVNPVEMLQRSLTE